MEGHHKEHRRAAWRKRSAEREVRIGLGIPWVYSVPAVKGPLVRLLLREQLLSTPNPTKEEIEIALAAYVARQAARDHA